MTDILGNLNNKNVTDYVNFREMEKALDVGYIETSQISGSKSTNKKSNIQK